jgi:hypothetical protein
MLNSPLTILFISNKVKVTWRQLDVNSMFDHSFHVRGLENNNELVYITENQVSCQISNILWKIYHSKQYLIRAVSITYHGYSLKHSFWSIFILQEKVLFWRFFSACIAPFTLAHQYKVYSKIVKYIYPYIFEEQCKSTCTNVL